MEINKTPPWKNPRIRSLIVQGTPPANCQDFKNHTFASADDLEAYVEKHLKDESGSWGGVYGSPPPPRKSSEWCWGWTTGEIIELSRAGWPEVSSQVSATAVKVADRIIAQGTSHGFTADVTGAYPVVEAYLQGQPECMMRFTEGEAPVRAVEVVINGFVSFDTKSNDIFARGASIVSAVLALQGMGYAVTVSLRGRGRTLNKHAWSKINGDETSGLGVVLHRPGQTLDISRLMVWMCHPAWLRQTYYEALGLLTGAKNHSASMSPVETANGVYVIPPPNDGLWERPDSAAGIVKSILGIATF